MQSGTGHIGVYGINYLAFARLARENPPTLDEFLDSYCRDFFGPAAEPMAAIYRVWEKRMQSPTGAADPAEDHRRVSPPYEVEGLFTEASVKVCRKHIAKAFAATDDPIFRWRIERIQALLDYVDIWRAMPLAYRRIREGKKVGAKARADCLAWAQRMHGFAEKHLTLNDGIFPGNPADRLLESLREGS